MNKIGIVTIVDYKNYGNRLQNYALQEVLKSLNFQVETIVNRPIKNEITFKEKVFRTLKNMKKKPLKSWFQRVALKINYEFTKKRNLRLLNNKIVAFKDFTKKHIKETEFEVNPNNIHSAPLHGYDFFVAGSDQVWNPNFRRGFSFDFLTFAEKEKRVSYAPSFGVSEISNEYINNYKTWLSEIPFISVREKAGAKIIKSLTGRSATVLVDPTLLLTKKDWLTIAKPAKNKTKEKYLLTYFLGEISFEKDLEIKRIAASENLEIVNLANLKSAEYYAVDPSEFLDYINSASVFLTDSFHGVVFSILFNTPFVVYERIGKTPSMNSRIDNLLDMFKLKDRMYKTDRSSADIFQIDYSHIDSILEIERTKSYEFLKNALNLR